MIVIKASPVLSADEEMATTAVNNAAICANLIVIIVNSADRYSTVTLFARLRGWSTSVSLTTAVW
jgi:hypothetical protein